MTVFPPVFIPFDTGIRVAEGRADCPSDPDTDCVGLAGEEVTGVMVMLLVTLLAVVFPGVVAVL